MTDDMLGIKTREQLVEAISEGLQFHSGYEPDHMYYVDLTQQEVALHVGVEYSGEEWPLAGDVVVGIEPLTSHESFQALEEFADAQPDNVSAKLWRALDGHRPFARFRAAVEILDLLQDWYAFHDRWYAARAEEWMRDNGVDFVDGKIVATGPTSVWEGEADEFDDEYQEES